MQSGKGFSYRKQKAPGQLAGRFFFSVRGLLVHLVAATLGYQLLHYLVEVGFLA
jgi:hypothetical protein